MSNSILIIGGMGPQASLLLHKRILDEAVNRGAVHNDDYPLILHLSLPVADFIDKPVNKAKALELISGVRGRLW